MKIKAKIKNFFYGFIIVNILWYIIVSYASSYSESFKSICQYNN
mgnify:CR=1 FL=1